MKFGLDNTAPEARRVQVAGWRRLAAAGRWGQLQDCWKGGRQLAAWGRRLRGADEPRGDEPVEQFKVAQRVAEALTAAGVRHAVVGSVASSLHGEPRYTQDVDILAELFARHSGAFADLEKDFCLSANTTPAGPCFNLVHKASRFKVDVFVSQNRPFDRSRLERRQFVPEADLDVVTPEDAILGKLEDDGASERQ